MEASDWIALGSLVVAMGAGIFASLSVRHARRSADAADLSATESRRAADAAERSALADERAAEIAEHAEEDRRAPRLDFIAEGHSGQEAHVAVLLRSGPPEVEIHTTGVWILDTTDPGQRTTLAVDDRPTIVAGSARHLVSVDLRSRTAEHLVEVSIACRETGTASPRVWSRSRTVTFPAKPHGPATPLMEPRPASPRGLFRDTSNFDEGF